MVKQISISINERGETMNHSKRAIWAACNSEHGDRLLEITREHLKLVRVAMAHPPGPTQWVQDESHEIILARIEALRIERDAIIQKFKEVESDAGDSAKDNDLSK
jgi:hypothetical protein